MSTVQKIAEFKKVMKMIPAKDRLKNFVWFVNLIVARLRTKALSDSRALYDFLDTPNLYTLLVSGKELEECWWNEATVERAIQGIKKVAAHARDGELGFCVEEDFMNGVFKAMRGAVKAHKAERKRRIDAWHEELVAVVLAPCRVERFAESYGMEPIDWLLQNAGEV